MLKGNPNGPDPIGTGQVTRAGELSGGKRRSKMLLARVTGQLALLRYGG